MTGKPFEVPAEMRDLAEKSVEQAKKAFDGYMGAAARTMDLVQNSQTSAQASVTGLGQKALGYVSENVSAAFDLAQKMVRAKDPREIMELQASFLRQQMEAFQTQAKDFGGAAQKTAQSLQSAAQDMLKPKKD